MVAAIQFARQVARELDWSASVVAGPDHPYLLTSPDLLFADEYGLAALFVEHAAEVRNDRQLLTRQVLSELALPSNTRFLLIPRDLDENVRRAQDWDLVVGSHSARYVADSLRGTPRRRPLTSADVREFALTRRRESRRIGPPALYESLRVRYGEAARRYRNMDADEAGLVASKRVRSTSEATRQVIRAMTASIPVEFGLDNGAVYPSSDELGTHRLVLAGSLDETRVFDSNKISRAAAFAGWTLLGNLTSEMWDAGVGEAWLEPGDE